MSPSFFKKIYIKISTIGYSSDLVGYEKKRVLVFNQLNFLALILSLVRFIYVGINCPKFYSLLALSINGCLSVAFLVLMWFMYKQLFKTATIFSFLVVPFLFALVNWVSKDEGIDMFVINYMMFCFFFLHKLRNSLIAFCYCFIIFLIIHFKLEKDIGLVDIGTPSFNLTLFNYGVAFIMFFATLFLIKYRVWEYEKSITHKTKALEERNIEIEVKNDRLKMQSEKLESKTKELAELSQVKTKLFSVISHDLRTTLYSFKNILDAHRHGYINNEDLLKELPDLSNEIDNCTEVMDNLLNWGKDQFKETTIMPELINLMQLVQNSYKFIGNRLNKKSITFVNEVSADAYAYADKQMIQIVLRNLISNAVKFTPTGGVIKISSIMETNAVKLLVDDTGIGISIDAVQKISDGKTFTTQGTNNEIGTGLGLIICKDFIQANNGQLNVETTDGEGSTFIISLPNK